MLGYLLYHEVWIAFHHNFLFVFDVLLLSRFNNVLFFQDFHCVGFRWISLQLHLTNKFSLLFNRINWKHCRWRNGKELDPNRRGENSLHRPCKNPVSACKCLCWKIVLCFFLICVRPWSFVKKLNTKNIKINLQPSKTLINHNLKVAAV